MTEAVAGPAQDDYVAWKGELAGKPRGLAAGQVGSGFWSLKAAGGRIGVATWRDEDGDMVAQVGGKDPILADADFCERVFSKVRPEHEADYRRAVAGEPWPDEARMPPKRAPRAAKAEPKVEDSIVLPPDTSHLDQRNDAAPEHVLVLGQIQDLETDAKKWLKEIGGKITSETEAAKAASFKEQFQKLSAAADRTRVAEVAPHLKAQRDVNGNWNSVIDKANKLKLWADGLPQEWLREEQRKRTEEARAAAEAARAAEPAAAAPVVVEPVRVKVGPGRGISTPVNKPKLVVEDWNVLATHMATLPIFTEDPAVRSVMFRLAEQRLAAGVDVPGARLDKAPAV